MARKKQDKSNEPVILNRKAKHTYDISDTLEVGVRLTGTEVKSVRDGRVSLAEGYVRVQTEPLELSLHGVHIAEYPPAGAGPLQHTPDQTRRLLAHKREIKKLADATIAKGVTIVPLKMYFKEGRIKLSIGVGTGKKQADKRRDIREREVKREIDRAMSRKL